MWILEQTVSELPVLEGLVEKIRQVITTLVVTGVHDSQSKQKHFKLNHMETGRQHRESQKGSSMPWKNLEIRGQEQLGFAQMATL